MKQPCTAALHRRPDLGKQRSREVPPLPTEQLSNVLLWSQGTVCRKSMQVRPRALCHNQRARMLVSVGLRAETPRTGLCGHQVSRVSVLAILSDPCAHCRQIPCIQHPEKKRSTQYHRSPLGTSWCNSLLTGTECPCRLSVHRMKVLSGSTPSYTLSFVSLDGTSCNCFLKQN